MCGIAGIVNKKPRKFDYSTFCTLGITNDSRGGDSCGIFIDGHYDYGVNDKKLFSNFFYDNKLLASTKESEIALLHCRKASIGKIGIETAQPVILKDKNNKVEFVVIHNGTIYNYKELAKKYIPNIDITGMTDSQVMTRIFYYCGYDVLSEYVGGAVFVIVDYREKYPKTFLFKGASKKNKWSKEKTDERPLYYHIDPVKKELVFSSIGIYLLALRTNYEVYSLTENKLYSFIGTDLKAVKIINRDNVYQTEEKKYDFYYDSYVGYSYTSNYITIDHKTLSYRHNNKPVHGEIFLHNNGLINTKKSEANVSIYFFNGIPLGNKKYFNFLTSLHERSGLEAVQFLNKYWKLIRYLSIDKIFIDEKGIYRICTSPLECTKFSGDFEPLCSLLKYTIKEGLKTITAYKSAYDNLSDKLDDSINLKEILKQC